MSAPFAPGDVVQCVDDRPSPVWGASPLRKGSCYRIAAVGPDRINNLTGVVCQSVFLVGVKSNSPHGFGSVRFRKIDDEVEESFRLMLRSLKTPPVPASSPAGCLVPRSVAAHIFGEG